MKETKRIIIWVIILLGGVFIFAYWAHVHFNLALSEIEKFNQSSFSLAPLTQKSFGTTTENKVAVTSTETNSSTNNTVFEFIYPENKKEMYKNCNYLISWLNPYPINSINLSLVDAGTKEVMGPIAGGIPKNISGVNLESFEWKVGDVWPGEYYIVVSNINGQEVKERSYKFNIKDLPENTDESKLEKFCE